MGEAHQEQIEPIGSIIFASANMRETDGTG
jgi:hypothetical protein